MRGFGGENPWCVQRLFAYKASRLTRNLALEKRFFNPGAESLCLKFNIMNLGAGPITAYHTERFLVLSCDCHTRTLLSTIGTTAPVYRQNVRQARLRQTLCPALSTSSQVVQGPRYHAQKRYCLIRGELYFRKNNNNNSSSPREVFFSFCLSLGARVRKQFGREVQLNS